MATHQIAQSLAQMGRNGDSMLMHVQPREVAGLQALAEANGTSLSINPHTGMPEAFSLGGVLGAIAPIAAGFALGPGGFGAFTGTNAALMSGLTVGALTGLATGDLGKGLMAGMGAYGGASLGDTLAKAGQGVVQSVEQTGANAGKDLFQAGSMDPSAINKPFMQAAPAPAYNPNIVTPQGGMTVGPQGAIGPNYNTVGGNLAGGYDPTTPFSNVNLTQSEPIVSEATLPAGTTSTGPTSNFDYAMKGAKELVTPEGWQNFKNAGGSGTQLAMMGGSALLGGLEPVDIYGKPLKGPNDKYDPYATLNLGGPSSQGGSGLRLLAAGGPVSFAKGGSPALQGGGSGAMQGADPIRVGGAAQQQPGGFGFMNQMMGRGVVPVELGLFADQSMIDAAQARHDAAVRNQSRFGLSGWGQNNGYMGMGGWQNANGSSLGMGGIGGLNRSKSSGDSIGHLNLNDQQSIKLATGGVVPTGSTNTSGGNMDLYGTSDNLVNPPISQDGYGIGRLDRLSRTSADSSASQYQFAHGGYLDGHGDGMSDSIPATIEGKQPARLADGEFVVPADVVSHLGNGSTKAGAQRLYGMLDKVRKARTGTTKQGKKINPNRFLPA